MRVAPAGKVVLPEDDFAPVILEVMAKSDVKSFDAFRAKVKACKADSTGRILRYQTIYGDVLTLDLQAVAGAAEFVKRAGQVIGRQPGIKPGGKPAAFEDDGIAIDPPEAFKE